MPQQNNKVKGKIMKTVATPRLKKMKKCFIRIHHGVHYAHTQDTEHSSTDMAVTHTHSRTYSKKLIIPRASLCVLYRECVETKTTMKKKQS